MVNIFKKGHILGGVMVNFFKKAYILGGVKHLLASKIHDLGGSRTFSLEIKRPPWGCFWQLP